ncbi:MAG: hypothetical protein FJ294_10455 [Planctomycetes bacterium]|nr:hypothetical protein [Planctomycetota bacterium]
MGHRWFVALLALAAVALLWRLVASRATPEERIRAVIEAQLNGLHRGQARPILDGLSDDFVDRTSRATRDDVRRALFLLFEEGCDPETGEFEHMGRLDPEDGLEIEVAEDGESARVRLHILFHRRDRGALLVTWDALIEGELRERDGWQWTSTSAVNHSQRRWRF